MSLPGIESLGLSAATGVLAQMEWAGFPKGNSTFASSVDNANLFIFWLSMFFFVGIMGATAWFAWVYRRRPGMRPLPSPHHNLPLEVTWTVIPSLLCVVMFAVGFAGYMDMSTPPTGNTFDVNVTAKQWAWTFQYPNGVISDDLHIPLDKPTRLIMRSQDVLHSMFIPVTRAKMDVVPGRYTSMWFQPLYDGSFDLYCTEYCGTNHSEMNRQCVIHKDQADFDAWMVVASDPTKNPAYLEGQKAGGAYLPAVYGQDLYTKRGCAGCHSIDGKKNTGPSFKGSWGSKVELETGSPVVFDENYARESILNPMAKVHKGYPPKMPSFAGQLKDRDIDAIIAFLKTLQ